MRLSFCFFILWCCVLTHVTSFAEARNDGERKVVVFVEITIFGTEPDQSDSTIINIKPQHVKH